MDTKHKPSNLNTQIFLVYEEFDYERLKKESKEEWTVHLSDDDQTLESHLFLILNRLEKSEVGLYDVLEYKYVLPRIKESRIRHNRNPSSSIDDIFGDLCARDLITSSQEIFNQLIDKSKGNIPTTKDYTEVYLHNLSADKQDFMLWELINISPERPDYRAKIQILLQLSKYGKIPVMTKEEISFYAKRIAEKGCY